MLRCGDVRLVGALRSALLETLGQLTLHVQACRAVLASVKNTCDLRLAAPALARAKALR